jgi:hypothetical protein
MVLLLRSFGIASSISNQGTAGIMMKSDGYEDVTFTRVNEKLMVRRTPEALAIGPGYSEMK